MGELANGDQQMGTESVRLTNIQKRKNRKKNKKNRSGSALESCGKKVRQCFHEIVYSYVRLLSIAFHLVGLVSFHVSS